MQCLLCPHHQKEQSWEMNLPSYTRIVDATEAHLHHVQEEKEHTTEALKKAKEEAIEQRWVVK
jgi:hypothetical protein